MAINRRRSNELRTRCRNDRRGLGGRVLFSRGHCGAAPLPGYADTFARTHQSGQPRPGPRGPGLAAAGRKPAHRIQARLHLAPRAAGRGHSFAAHCARRPPSRTASMNIATALETTLAAVVLGLAIWTIAARETFAAVVGFIAYGLLLSLIWVRLDAVDVALTEAAIGGGLGGVLLLGAAARLKAAETAEVERSGIGVRLGAAVLSVAVAAALA